MSAQSMHALSKKFFENNNNVWLIKISLRSA